MTVIQSFKRKNNKDGSSVENDKRKGNVNLFATVTSEDSEVSKDSDEDKWALNEMTQFEEFQ